MANAYIPIGELFNVQKGQLQSTKCTPGEFDFITAAEEWKTHESFEYDCEALIFAAAASGSLGRTHYVDGKFISSDLCYILTPKDEQIYPLNLEFYHFVFNSLRTIIVKATKSGTSKESINQSNFKKFELPYFDIEQQNLWITKLRDTLVRKDLMTAELGHQKSLLIKLRQRILQDAIEGKLTASWRFQKQDIESAATLLTHISSTKSQLLQEKKIKPQKALPPISDKEKSFEIPDSWSWCRLQDISKLVTDGKHGDCQNAPNSGYYFLSAKDIQNDELIYTNARQILSSEFHEVHARTNLEPGDICMVNTGATIGKTAIAPDNALTKKTTFQKSVAVIKLIKPYIDERFIKIYLANETDKMFATSWGSAINNLLLGDLKKQLVPLPPIMEQRAIATKVEALFNICDRLEAVINENQKHAEQLVQAVLKEAFNHEVQIPKVVNA